MTQLFSLALIALSSVTGLATEPALETTNLDLINIANAINCENTNDLEGVKLNDLYSVNGSNRFIEASTDDEYVIYDKETKEIVEQGNLSPYQGYDDYFKVYYSDDTTPGYMYFDGEDFNLINVTNASKPYPYTSISSFPADAKLIPNSFYFIKLGQKYHNNTKGTCTIAAIEMMLGYYDAFMNDKLVPEQYDVIAKTSKSTKIVSEFTEMPGTGSFRTGGDAFAQTLFTLCKSETGVDVECGDGLSTSDQSKLIKKYLNNTNLPYSYNTSIGNWADRISNRQKDVIRNAINAGRPVIANGNGHSVVAYGYDDNNVYINLGWGYTGRYATPWSTFTTSMFDFTWDCGAIDFAITNHFHSDNFLSTGLNQYVCPCGATISHHLFKAEDFGFKNQYFFYEKSCNFDLDGITLETKRLRCGYIEEESINLSCRRQNAGEAYLEFKLPTYFYGIKMDASYWGYSEYFSVDSTIQLQYFDDSANQWKNYYDLKDITHDRTNKTNLNIKFDNGVSKIRIYCSDLATGNSNRGRIALDNIELLYL